MIGHPPSGGSPFGAKTVPVTRVGWFVTPDVEAYVTLAATDVTPLSRRSSVGMLLAATTVPGPEPLRSAGSEIPASGGGAPDAADGLSHADDTATATIAASGATVGSSVHAGDFVDPATDAPLDPRRPPTVDRSHSPSSPSVARTIPLPARFLATP